MNLTVRVPSSVDQIANGQMAKCPNLTSNRDEVCTQPRELHRASTTTRSKKH